MTALQRIEAVVTILPRGEQRQEMESHVDSIRRAPVERQELLVAAVSEAYPALSHLATVAERLTLPESVGYPSVSPGIAARLLLGERPVDLVPGMTRREAHEWLLSGAPSAGEWYIERHCPDATGSSVDPELPVACWLAARWRRPEQRTALLRQRREVVAGEVIEGRYIDRLDELRKNDLRPSVDETFKRAGTRMQRRMERSLQSKGEPLAPEPRWWRPGRHVRLLNTGPDLVSEGRAMRHCVASYADAVKSRCSVIVGMLVMGERSTVELDRRTVEVRQHRGVANGTPSQRSVRVLNAYLRLWKKAA
jgi:hypothetical protein